MTTALTNSGSDDLPPGGGSGHDDDPLHRAARGPVDPDAPVTVIDQHSGSAWASLKAAFGAWELLYLLSVRDLTVRYRQTIVGVGWAVLNPLLLTLVLTVFFGVLGRIGPAGVPYAPFLLGALIMWRFFESALGRTSDSLVANVGLLDKVAFPRFVLPMASVLSPLVDLAIGLVVLAGVMLFYRVTPLSEIVLFPFYLLVTLLAALGMGLWLAGLNAHYRDISHILQVTLRLGFYATPVLYSLDLVPEKYHLLYSINPMVPVIVATRHALCGRFEAIPDATMGMWAVSLTVTTIVLVSGIFVFNRLEKRIADVI